MEWMQQISILGLGLIGGSLARAVKSRLPHAMLTVMDANPATLAAAQVEGVAAHYTEDPSEAVKRARLVVLAVPPSALADVAARMAPGLAEGVVVTDVCSVKRYAVRAVQPALPAFASLVPGHPIAGAETQGFQAGRADLFQGKPVILCPETPEAPGIHAAQALWQATGARVEYMPADLHDRIYACVSHLPQYVAFALGEDYWGRLRASPRPMWQEIFAANHDYMHDMVQRYVRVLARMVEELREGASEIPASPASPQALFAKVFAACMVSVAYQLERELGVPMAHFAGSGFADFTAPLMGAEGETDLQEISAHAAVVLPHLEAALHRLGAAS